MTNDGSGNDGKGDDQVAAATSDDPAPTDVATDPTTAATTEATVEETKEPRRPHRDVRRNGIRIGKVYTLRNCLRSTRDGTRRLDEMPKVVKLEGGKHKWRLYTVREGRRVYAVEGACKWVRLVEKPRRDQ